jgi:diaminohydroxyphosphoribosylaminopyrimidine deaminase/5-amino-6-(5-phosphoribosylamino)uracil reductase
VAAAGIARVVASVRDPNPVVDGAGFRVLAARGVDVTEGVLAADGAALIQAFARHVTTGLPLVTLKMAASLDGRVAARDGSSRWVTGEDSRRDVHRVRAGSGAVMVGAGTALADDPALTVRVEGYRGRPPLRILVDGRGRVPATGALFDGAAPTLVVSSLQSSPRRRSEWELAGAEVLVIEGTDALVPLPALVEVLGKREVQSILVEGGPTLAWACIEAGIVDRLVLYIAPKLIGGTDAPGVLGGAGAGSIDEAVPLTIRSTERLGVDLKVMADVHRHR